MIEALLILALHLPAASVPPSAPQEKPPAIVQQPPVSTGDAAPPPGGESQPVEDPARASFTTGVGLLLVPVKPDHVEAYEKALAALQAAFQESSDPARRAMAAGWRVYRAEETDAKKNVIYVHAILPVVPDADYRPSILLDDMLAGAPADLLTAYRDAMAGPPSKLSLVEVANMSVARVKK